MLWKEKLRVGVDIIDEQHIELFARTEKLLREVYDSGVKNKEECIDAIVFLKNYAVRHFADEEAYQLSIGYKDYASHKKLHEDFVKTVLIHEKKMTASDFAEKDVKEFTGMLIAWLLYHVADKDQTIGKVVKDVKQSEDLRSHGDIVCYSVGDVLNKMAGFDVAHVRLVDVHGETFADTIDIELGLTGDISGYITLVYPDEFIKNMISSMMGFVPEVIEDLEISALIEVSNIISGMICGTIAKDKGIICDISIPQITKRSEIMPDERITLDTGRGIMETDISIVYL